ncbi:hypothetical protein A2U01_0025616, partial [Trifolium medium]|nr:hypothetical protein [Trifolium medium]
TTSKPQLGSIVVSFAATCFNLHATACRRLFLFKLAVVGPFGFTVESLCFVQVCLSLMRSVSVALLKIWDSPTMLTVARVVGYAFVTVLVVGFSAVLEEMRLLISD